MFPQLTAAQVLPADGYAGTLIGRALYPGVFPGPCVAVIREDGVHNISGTIATVAELLNQPNPLGIIHRALSNCAYLGTVDELLANSTPETHDPLKPYFLTPIDLQAVKGTGVTFVGDMLQRLADENGGAATVQLIERAADQDIHAIRPGTKQAQAVRDVLIEAGLWSAYLEVGFGPDIELFTKAQPLSTVGLGAEIGLHPDSIHNFAEPELVMVTDGQGRPRGVTMGVDLTLCDVEARSPLLLGKAKDNTASSAVGPFIRLFDESFSMPSVQGMKMTYIFEGPDSTVITDAGSMEDISRSLISLVRQTVNEHHGYPDGVALYTGTMFSAPTERGGQGPFTHMIGDVVTIKTPALGGLVTRINATNQTRRWNFGLADLMQNLAARQLLG
ncbi:fumarylacetoacetate hydrolase family protein [Pseudomonadota bacterium]